MNKRLIISAAVFAAVLAGCFYAVHASLKRLPPGSIHPSSKPAIHQYSGVNPLANSALTLNEVVSTSSKSPNLNPSTLASNSDSKKCQPNSTPHKQNKPKSPAQAQFSVGEAAANSNHLEKADAKLTTQIQGSLLNVASGLNQ